MSVLRSIVLAAGLVVALWLGAAGTAEADVSSSFDPAGGRLTVVGGAEDDIAVTCRGGEVKVNGRDATGPPLGCSAVVDLLVDIDAEAAGSNRIDLAGVGSGEFTRLARTVANGDRGDDTIIGTATEDTLLGGGGSDRVTGFRGDDVVFGGDGLGAGDDDGDRDGDDTLVWNDGDGSDVIDGEAGGDSVVVNGSAANRDEFAVRPDRGRVRFERTNLGRFRLDLQRAETLQMNGGGGDDRITGSAGLAGLVRLRMNGGAGDDLLIGSDGDDVMDAGPGDDTMVCGAGHDLMAGNDGDDRMVWIHGDGSDVMDGDAGGDVAEVNGAPAADDDFAVGPNGVRVRFERRNLAPFQLDIATTETLRVDGGGGDDRVRTARDLGGLIAGAFYGGEGADRLGGTEGADLLSGGPGRDVLRARDRAADRVDCGDGLDVAGVDRHDQVRRCELVVGGRPRVRLSRKVAETRAGVAFVRARCVATARCRGFLRLGHGRVALGGERFSIARGTGKTVRVRLNRRGRRLVSAASPKSAKVAVRIVARDATGNGWRSAARVRLRGEI